MKTPIPLLMIMKLVFEELGYFFFLLLLLSLSLSLSQQEFDI